MNRDLFCLSVRCFTFCLLLGNLLFVRDGMAGWLPKNYGFHFDMKRVVECERHARIECLIAAGAWQSEHIRRSVFMVCTLGVLER